MKLLCDVCENAVASLICCADEMALCLSCDSRIHAANKLTSKHQCMQLLSEASQRAVCDICQEGRSSFFCMEDRALFCRECDVSIHSADTLEAKHRRFLLTGIQVGVSSSMSPSQETASAIAFEQYMLGMSSPNRDVKKRFELAATMTTINCGNDNGNLGEMSNYRAVKKPCRRAVTTKTTTMNCSKDNGGVSSMGTGSKEALSPEKENKASAPSAMNVKPLILSYMMNEQGTLSILPSNTDSKAAMEYSKSNSSISTTISIQRISSGTAPFLAPVLSTSHAALTQEKASSHIHNHKSIHINNIKGNNNNNNNNDNNDDDDNDVDNNNTNNDNNININNNVMMNVDSYPPVQSDDVYDYLTFGMLPDWRFDEFLEDLVGVCESVPSLSP